MKLCDFGFARCMHGEDGGRYRCGRARSAGGGGGARGSQAAWLHLCLCCTCGMPRWLADGQLMGGAALAATLQRVRGHALVPRTRAAAGRGELRARGGHLGRRWVPQAPPEACNLFCSPRTALTLPPPPAGCLLAELATGLPLFPGENDMDQLYLILKCFGQLPPQQTEWLHKHPMCVGAGGRRSSLRGPGPPTGSRAPAACRGAARFPSLQVQQTARLEAGAGRRAAQAVCQPAAAAAAAAGGLPAARPPAPPQRGAAGGHALLHRLRRLAVARILCSAGALGQRSPWDTYDT